MSDKPAFDLVADYAPSGDQPEAIDRLCEGIQSGLAHQTLLGVTGSGKTEVYFEAIAEAIRGGRQAVVLLPEIALSAQWLARFVERFGEKPVVWHSEIGLADKRRAWRAVADGRVPVVVGALAAKPINVLPYVGVM